MNKGGNSMERVKVYIETKGVGDVVYDALLELIAKNELLESLITIRKIPATSVVIIKEKGIKKERIK